MKSLHHSPLWFVHKLSSRGQHRLATFAPVGAAGLGVLFLLPGSPFESWWSFSTVLGVCASWGIGLKLGSKSKPLLLRLTKTRVPGVPGPSWTLAALAGLLFAGFWLVIICRQPLPSVLGHLAVALHITYAGAKLRCRVLRCCEPHRRSWARQPLAIASLYLQDIEILASLAGAVATYALLNVEPSIAGAIGFAFHAILRGLDWNIRFPWRRIKHLLRDPGCGGFLLIAFVSLISPLM